MTGGKLHIRKTGSKIKMLIYFFLFRITMEFNLFILAYSGPIKTELLQTLSLSKQIKHVQLIYKWGQQSTDMCTPPPTSHPVIKTTGRPCKYIAQKKGLRQMKAKIFNVATGEGNSSDREKMRDKRDAGPSQQSLDLLYTTSYWFVQPLAEQEATFSAERGQRATRGWFREQAFRLVWPETHITATQEQHQVVREPNHTFSAAQGEERTMQDS